MFTIKNICEFLWEIEAKYDLHKLEISGTRAWECSRFDVFIAIATSTNIFNNPHPALSTSKRIAFIVSSIKNAIIRNPFLAKKSDVVIFTHPRAKKVNGQYIDIYTHYLIEKELLAGKSVTEIEGNYQGRHIKPPNSYCLYTDFILLISRLLHFFVNIVPENPELGIIQKANSEINNKFNCNIDLYTLLVTKVRQFKSDYILYYALLKKIAPSTLYLVVSYYHQAVIKAAKDLGIETIELQHGTITKYHMGYSFPNIYKDAMYFPNKLYTWNDFWKFMARCCPLKENDVIAYGFEYQTKQLEKYKYIKRQKNTLIVLSQTTVSNAIATELISHFNYFRHMQITYKLHPNEYLNWRNYPALVELSSKENVKIVTDVDLYELLVQSEYQAGVYSTALFEGADAGCKTVLFNLPGIEYMTEFIEFNKLSFSNNMYLPECLSHR